MIMGGDGARNWTDRMGVGSCGGEDGVLAGQVVGSVVVAVAVGRLADCSHYYLDTVVMIADDLFSKSGGPPVVR
jgi:hypothetical protein